MAPPVMKAFSTHEETTKVPSFQSIDENIMKIVIENISDGEQVNHPILLIKGRVDSLDCSILQDADDEDKVKKQLPKLLALHKVDRKSDYVLVETISLALSGKFKLLVHLHPGSNWFNFEFCRVSRDLYINYNMLEADHHNQNLVQLVYIVCSDANGDFQAPANVVNDEMAALKRISLVAGLLQCFLSDSLDAHGFGRKTVQYVSNKKMNNLGLPYVYTFKSALSTSQAHQMTGQELWTYHAKELIQWQGPQVIDKVKFLAITSATRYTNQPGSTCKLDMDHDEVLSMTKAHVALGGGGLALFGSGCLYTWPEKLHNVQAALVDDTPVDTSMFMDDSAYRGTLGGCFATTLGALLHELGHTLDLGHTTGGIMARGFDDMDRFFTISTPANQKSCSKLTLPLCDGTQPGGGKDWKCGLDEAEVGANFLDGYQKRKYYRKMVQDCGGAFWSRSCALILSSHKWLRTNDDFESELTFDPVTCVVTSTHPQGICCIELRDSNNTVVSFEEPRNNQTHLHIVQTMTKDTALLVAVDFGGHMLKIQTNNLS